MTTLICDHAKSMEEHRGDKPADTFCDECSELIVCFKTSPGDAAFLRSMRILPVLSMTAMSRGLAKGLFIERHAGRLIYHQGSGRWMRRNGSNWGRSRRRREA
jgi:hypothetical protein